MYAGQTSGFAPGAAAFAVVCSGCGGPATTPPLPALLAAAGFAWLAVRRRGCALAAAAMAACLAVTAFAFGDYHIYYALPLSVFAPSGLVPLAGLARRLPALPARLRRVLPGAGAVLAVGFCLLASPNADQLLRPAQQLPQYRFAADIRADGGGTLLNYGTLDGGFYTVAGQLPPLQIFLRHQPAAGGAAATAGPPCWRPAAWTMWSRWTPGWTAALPTARRWTP